MRNFQKRQTRLVSPDEFKALQEKISSKSDEIAAKDDKLEKAIAENEELRKQMAKVREQNTGSRIFRIDTLTEAETRKSLIDIELQEAGWVINGNCTLEVPITDIRISHF